MSSLLAHLWQAGRNESLATQLLEQGTYREWVVVATFYSALHFVEAALTQKPGIGHSETSKPQKFGGSFHDWREDILLRDFPVAWQPYRKLRVQSMIARYLSSGAGSAVGKPVEDYFGEQDVRDFLLRDLSQIRRDLGIA